MRPRVRECDGATVQDARVQRFISAAVLFCVVLAPVLAAAQVMEQITFDDAIRRATANNPTVQQAAAGILRAEALLQQAVKDGRL